MPRPKRTRRAPAASAVAAVTAVATEDKSSPAPASGSDIYSHSDREHSVIRKEHEEETRLRRSTSLRQRKAAGGASDEATESTKNNNGKPAEDQQKSDSSVEAGRKTRATPVQQRRDTTGLDLDDDLFGLDTTMDDDDDPAAAPPSAPRSDTSTFSVSNFRRRGRAPSISINKDDNPIRPSSRGISTPGISSMFNIGNFRRRQREPSILGTAQKERAQRPLEPSSEPESGDENEEDFNPEAESTPINNRRRTQPPPAVEPDSDSEAEPVTDSQQVLAPDSQPEREAAATSSAKSRKRKSVESHDDEDRPGKTSRTEPEQPELIDDDSDSSLSDLPSPVLTPTRASNIPRPVTPNQDEIMAPPESSGSEDNEAWPDIHTLAKHRRRRASPTTPMRDGNMSDVSSPPSLTHSPNFPATRKNAQKKKQQKKMTTAELTGLLPQRRHKKTRDPFDAEDSEDEDEDVENANGAPDDDELSYADTRTRSRRAKAAPLNRSSANRPPSRGGKTTATAKSKPATRSSRPSRTYSRRLSDKENQVEDEGAEVEDAEDVAEPAGEAEESFAPGAEDETVELPEGSDPMPTAEELKQAARKFKEVDRWELEFEEVTEASSPNRDAR
ncbi:hypothetical protein GCG54_00006742 [Colletotrichum gloeosporioides]|uniref:Uncharacterized protein n=2 Tax=Colletotrichum gloeosporioides TaxID=474922 RepID=T0LXA4_COLGC|nr:uncharacterized protein GCG54_00006742 [Colletotrichum gloeosporioides]EQB53010.1 hypothetical protein CGLO_07329 [Colletotrichum gloeosporioides Cg-14]KAF3801234.1 hypothetical protein GCG54_00006742 [Colletotrichum gloeosporioides]